MNFRFYKMNGCGNDFLILDDFSGQLPDLSPSDVRYLCHRNLGLGADGLAVLRTGKDTDAKWTFFNCDGSEAEMCGNAARCVIRYLADHHFPGGEVISLQTQAGVIRGRVLEEGAVEVTLLSERDSAFSLQEKVIEANGEMLQIFSVNTGVPHAVIEVKSLHGYPVAAVGAVILNHPAFAPEKTNVTFFQRSVGSRIISTTFERGVEQETFACGTGAAAAALVFSEIYFEPLPVEVVVPGGELTVGLSPATRYLLLTGPAVYVAKLEIEELPSEFTVPALFGSKKGNK